jgi:hypothetical protein
MKTGSLNLQQPADLTSVVRNRCPACQQPQHQLHHHSAESVKLTHTHLAVIGLAGAACPLQLSLSISCWLLFAWLGSGMPTTCFTQVLKFSMLATALGDAPLKAARSLPTPQGASEASAHEAYQNNNAQTPTHTHTHTNIIVHTRTHTHT